jgi:RNA polymerase sigma-70 factor (sigma-E family)
MSVDVRSASGPTPDEEGFRHWLSIRGTQLRRKAYLMSGDWHAADDICQDVFIQLYSKWAKVVKGGNVDGYANRVLVGCYVDTTRRPWRRERVTDTPPDFSDPSADDAINLVDGADEPLQRALASLPANQRSVVVLRFTDDLTVEEIAHELGIPAGTVKSRLSRGIESLRTALTIEAAEVAAGSSTVQTMHTTTEILDTTTRGVESLS